MENDPDKNTTDQPADSEQMSDALKQWLEVTREQPSQATDSVHQFPWDHIAIDRPEPNEPHPMVAVVIRIGSSSASPTALENIETNQIIGFEQQIDSPVELMINDEVIASGLLSVQDGRYAVRITGIDGETGNTKTDSSHKSNTKAS